MKILIYREQHGNLTRHGAIEVPDNTSQPEELGWSLYTRGGTLPSGTYVAIRAGRRFRAEQKTTNSTAALGPMT